MAETSAAIRTPVQPHALPSGLGRVNVGWAMKWAISIGLVAVAVALAQTQLRPGQMRSAMPGSLERTFLYAVSLDGWTGVEVGPGLRLEPWRQGLRLVADVPAQPAPAAPRIQMQQLKPAQGIYRCGVAPQLVLRNGLVQMPGVDYRIVDEVAIFPADPGWAADDVVACLFI